MLGFLDLQHFYGIGIDDYFRDHGEDFGFAPQHFLSIYLEARRKAYSLANIESAFRATGIVPFNSRILTKLGSTLKFKENFKDAIHQVPATPANKFCPCIC